VLLPFLLLLAPDASAQAYVDKSGQFDHNQLFWLLALINMFLFIVVWVQIIVLRGLTRGDHRYRACGGSSCPFNRTGPGWKRS
jgi:hypothetical protein